MQRIEEYRTLIRRIKYIKGKFSNPCTTLVTQQQTYGRTLEITDKIPLEKVIIEENLKKYHQIEGACQLLGDPRLYRDIGSFGEVTQVEAILNGMYVCPDNSNQVVNKLLRQLQLQNTVSNK